MVPVFVATIFIIISICIMFDLIDIGFEKGRIPFALLFLYFSTFAFIVFISDMVLKLALK